MKNRIPNCQEAPEIPLYPLFQRGITIIFDPLQLKKLSSL
jgi:hypothetical protein